MSPVPSIAMFAMESLGHTPCGRWAILGPPVAGRPSIDLPITSRRGGKKIEARVDPVPPRSSRYRGAVEAQDANRIRKEHDMRVMVMVKATKNSEKGGTPSEKMLTEMGQFNEQLVKAGVMLAG